MMGHEQQIFSDNKVLILGGDQWRGKGVFYAPTKWLMSKL